MKGSIFGDEQLAQWTQSLYGKSFLHPVFPDAQLIDLLERIRSQRHAPGRATARILRR
jgi:hypothetical protein